MAASYCLFSGAQVEFASQIGYLADGIPALIPDDPERPCPLQLEGLLTGVGTDQLIEGILKRAMQLGMYYDLAGHYRGAYRARLDEIAQRLWHRLERAAEGRALAL